MRGIQCRYCRPNLLPPTKGILFMAGHNRREFIKTAGIGVAGTVAVDWAAAQTLAASANERIGVGIIGAGGRAERVAAAFAQRSGCDVVAICDIDEQHAAAISKLVQEAGASRAPKLFGDLRRVLDDPSIDAVAVTTPDHWHAPASILACEAGKHVYVEKPCSHNLREGRLLVEAARRNKCVVQHGTQSRSTAFIANGIQMLRDGVIGDVLAAKAWNVQRRDSIGHAQPGSPPSHVDYDTWIGPAPFVPFQENRFHRNWRWWHEFGTGDAGNDGVHELDYARWGLGVETQPTRISSIGGKFFFDDDQQFPDTQQVAYEYPGDGTVGNKRMLIFELRIWSPNYPYNVDNGTEFYGTKGRLMLTKRGKLELFDDKNRRLNVLREKISNDDATAIHEDDFLTAIRTGSTPNAEIEVGHLSTSLAHLANISVRVGRTLQFDPVNERVLGDAEANRMLSRNYREGHWSVPAGV